MNDKRDNELSECFRSGTRTSFNLESSAQNSPPNNKILMDRITPGYLSHSKSYCEV